MKKNIGIIIILITISSLTGTASGDGISIKKLTSELLPFNDLRDPVNDTLYNAFDGDAKTSALFSDMEIQFSIPVVIDELKIINGKSREYREFGRLRDLEIILYTTGFKKKAVTGDKKSSGSKSIDKQKSSSVDKGKKIQNDKDKNKKPDEMTPDKNKEKNENNEKKNSEGLTAVNNTDLNLPVIGTLNDVLADEPVKSSSSVTDSVADNKTETIKTDIRDADKIIRKKEPALKKNTPVKQKKKSDNKTGEKEVKTVKKTKKEKKSSDTSSLKKSDAPAKEKSADVKKNDTAEIKKKEPVQDKKETQKLMDDLPFKKMEGITTVENDSEGRVIVNISLKDISGEQRIKLGESYSITGFEIRKRDDYVYPGSISQLPYLSEIILFDKGKKISVQDIEPLKKQYEERFVQALTTSISGTVFSAVENDREVTRIIFTKDGRVESRDRYKCYKKGEPDCTSLLIPDMWMVRDGRLYMRYAGEWTPWKYEMEYTPELMGGADAESDVRQWLKIYYKDKNGFTDNFLYLEKSRSQNWRWD